MLVVHPVHHNNHPPSSKQPLPRTTITVVGIPSVTVQNNSLVVGTSQTSMFPAQVHICAHLTFLQALLVPIRLSKSLAMAPLELFCSAIGTEHYHPTPPSLLCSVVLARDQIGQACDSSQSRG